VSAVNVVVVVVVRVSDNAGVDVVEDVVGCSGSIIIFHGIVVIDYNVGVLVIASKIHAAMLLCMFQSVLI